MDAKLKVPPLTWRTPKWENLRVMFGRKGGRCLFVFKMSVPIAGIIWYICLCWMFSFEEHQQIQIGLMSGWIKTEQMGRWTWDVRFMFIWIPLHTPRFFFLFFFPLFKVTGPYEVGIFHGSSRVKPSKAMGYPRCWRAEFFSTSCRLCQQKTTKNHLLLTTFLVLNLGCCFWRISICWLVLNFIDGNRFKKQGTLLQGTFGLARPEPEAVQIKTKWQENDLRNASSFWFPCRFYIQISQCIAMQNAVWCRKNTI